MLVEFRVRNFRSFGDEQVLSLVASRDTTLDENCIREGGLKLLKSVAVYGANASGKSNLIKALHRMQDIVLNSAGYKPGRELDIAPFLLDRRSSQEPSMFEVTFYHEGVRYQYGFEASKTRIEEEWLFAYPKGAGQKWFSRTFNKSKSQYDWNYSSFLKGEKTKLAEKTRENALFLSVAAQWNHAQLGAVYEWFRRKLQVVDSRHSLGPITAEMLLPSNESDAIAKAFSELATTLLQQADLGITGVAVKKKRVDVDEIIFPEGMPSEVRNRFLEELAKQLDVEMVHRTVEADEDVSIPLEEESDGTQEFFKLIGPWVRACTFGITVFIDELEASLHPLLARNLVELILNTEISRQGAQLLFTTHDTTLQDPELLRRDQIWFTEKDEAGATRLCPLSDYSPRKGEAIQKGYLSGRYGAIPMLERFSLK